MSKTQDHRDILDRFFAALPWRMCSFSWSVSGDKYGAGRHRAARVHPSLFVVVWTVAELREHAHSSVLSPAFALCRLPLKTKIRDLVAQGCLPRQRTMTTVPHSHMLQLAHRGICTKILSKSPFDHTHPVSVLQGLSMKGYTQSFLDRTSPSHNPNNTGWKREAAAFILGLGRHGLVC